MIAAVVLLWAAAGVLLVEMLRDDGAFDEYGAVSAVARMAAVAVVAPLVFVVVALMMLYEGAAECIRVQRPMRGCGR